MSPLDFSSDLPAVLIYSPALRAQSAPHIQLLVCQCVDARMAAPAAASIRLGKPADHARLIAGCHPGQNSGDE